MISLFLKNIFLSLPIMGDLVFSLKESLVGGEGWHGMEEEPGDPGMAESFPPHHSFLTAGFLQGFHPNGNPSTSSINRTLNQTLQGLSA